MYGAAGGTGEVSALAVVVSVGGGSSAVVVGVDSVGMDSVGVLSVGVVSVAVASVVLSDDVESVSPARGPTSASAAALSAPRAKSAASSSPTLPSFPARPRARSRVRPRFPLTADLLPPAFVRHTPLQEDGTTPCAPPSPQLSLTDGVSSAPVESCADLLEGQPFFARSTGSGGTA
jgi:hypothetical protein